MYFDYERFTLQNPAPLEEDLTPAGLPVRVFKAHEENDPENPRPWEHDRRKTVEWQYDGFYRCATEGGRGAESEHTECTGSERLS